MPVCPYCSSSDLTRDGHNQRGRAVRACGACGRHATSESTSLMAGHRFPRDIILLAVRYYLQLGAAAERIAGILADRGIDVSGRTILRWVQKFGPALSAEIRLYRKPVSTTWLVDETYVKILGKWHSCIAASTPMGRCSIAGCRGRATWRRPKPSSDAPSVRPGAHLSTWSPTKPRSIRRLSAPVRLVPGTRPPAFTTW